MMESKSGTSTKPFDLWAIVNSINSNKAYDWADIEAVYEPYIVNKALSYFPDTVLFADDMNRFFDVPKKAQYLYLINTIRPRKRFSKWVKNVGASDDFVAVQKYFSYNNRKTEDALKILTPAQIIVIKQKQETGGIK
jgi:hypothetical protein